MWGFYFTIHFALAADASETHLRSKCRVCVSHMCGCVACLRGCAARICVSVTRVCMGVRQECLCGCASGMIVDVSCIIVCVCVVYVLMRQALACVACA